MNRRTGWRVEIRSGDSGSKSYPYYSQGEAESAFAEAEMLFLLGKQLNWLPDPVESCYLKNPDGVTVRRREEV